MLHITEIKKKLKKVTPSLWLGREPWLTLWNIKIVTWINWELGTGNLELGTGTATVPRYVPLPWNTRQPVAEKLQKDEKSLASVAALRGSASLSLKAGSRDRSQ